MHDLHAGGAVQPLGHHVHGRACAGAGIGYGLAALGRRHHRGHGLHACVGVSHQHQRLRGGLDDRLEAVQHVVAGRRGELEHEWRRGERVWREQQRVAIGLGAADKGVAHRATGTRLVFNDHCLLQALREFVGKHARHGVGVTTRGVTHHHADRALGVGLGDGAPCNHGAGHEGGGHPLSTIQFHHSLL
ncbi:hypothetical protein D9M69_576430 [compost metagenome]